MTTYETLFSALAAEQGPADDVADLVLAATDGTQALEAHIAGDTPLDRREPGGAGDGVTSPKVFLTEIAVTNFRGVAERARLPLTPGPGLTVVVGRNGSGKSSFAEGFELLLTRSNLRWEAKPVAWREGWRNLHGQGPTALEATFAMDGESQPLKVSQRWAPDARLTEPDAVQVTGPRAAWDALGWDVPLQRYRPLLSYSELSTMFSERAKELYEALSLVLGVGEFDAVAEILRKARLARGTSAKAEKAARSALKARLEDVEDERAAVARTQLRRHQPDLDAVTASLVDPAAEEGVAQLRAVAELPVPTDVSGPIAAADEAQGRLRELEATDAERERQVAGLLEAAISFHVAHDEHATCPVCGTPDVLDASWSIRAQAELADLHARSADLRAVRAAAQAAASAVDALFPAATPQRLRAAGIDTTAAQDAWDVWREAPADPGRAEALHAALADVQARATAMLEEYDLSWRPVHAAITEWVGLAAVAAADKAVTARITQAEEWVKAFTATLRAERFAPVVDAARANWDRLRHDSNVQLTDARLKKGAAVFDVSVDGTAASAFGVMSQGELTALAISVFLPRASLPASPFGFLVIDDPVQAMDPAKVDGLARVLEAAARTRQVVVFTHDDRLPEAIDRLAIDAGVIHVQRRAQSKVEVVAGARPSRRAITEAFALCRTDQLPDAVRRRVVPVFCRTAIEAACDTAIRRREHKAGTAHADLQQRLEALTSTSLWLAEAFGLSKAQGREVLERVRAIGGDPAVAVVKAAKAGAHADSTADPLQLARATEKLVEKLEAM